MNQEQQADLQRSDREALLSLLAERGVSAPDAVSLMTTVTGDILRHALREHQTDLEEVQAVIAKIYNRLGRQTGVSAGTDSN